MMNIAVCEINKSGEAVNAVLTETKKPEAARPSQPNLHGLAADTKDLRTVVLNTLIAFWKALVLQMTLALYGEAKRLNEGSQ